MTEFECHARDIFAAVLAECEPAAAFDRIVRPAVGAWLVDGRHVDLSDVDDVRVIAMGKPALSLVGACIRALNRAGIPAVDRAGLAALPDTVVAPAVDKLPPWLDVEFGGHPLPTAGSFRAGRKVLDVCSAPASSRTLVVACVGGGGSAVAEVPILDGVSVDALAELNRHLLRADLTIRDVNAVRKRVSAIKGGRLAIAVRPARVMTFIVSDVAPGDIGSVASGPTVEDDTTRDEALAAISRLERSASLTPPCRRLVASASLVEPPTWSDFDRQRAQHVVLLDSSAASDSAARHAASRVDVVDNLGVVDGSVEKVVRAHIDRLARLTAAHPGAVCAVVSSGEATVEVRGSGSGGRNQHFALVALVAAREHLVELSDYAILCAGTDGLDGDTIAAGAVVHPGLLEAASLGGLDAEAALSAFDSAAFLAQAGAQVVTGPTGTNVRDLRVLIGVRR